MKKNREINKLGEGCNGLNGFAFLLGIFKGIIYTCKRPKNVYRYLRIEWNRFKRSHKKALNTSLIIAIILILPFIDVFILGNVEFFFMLLGIIALISAFLSYSLYIKIRNKYPRYNRAIITCLCSLLFLLPFPCMFEAMYLGKKYSPFFASLYVYVTENEDKYHWTKKCKALSPGEKVKCLKLKEAKEKGYTECDFCER